jgi:hypothetical protein
MSVSPIGGIASLSALQPATTAAPTTPSSAAAVSPTADAAQAWEAALRSVLGDDSSSSDSSTDPLMATLAGNTAATGTATASDPLAALTGAGSTASDQLAALVTGSATSSSSPLITSLSDPTAAASSGVDPTDATAAPAPVSDTDPSIVDAGLGSFS